MSDALADFHPLVRDWFLRKFPGPTDAQTGAWPLIREGRNVLVSAPTGSGKTMTAFLSALDCLIRGEWGPEALVRVLYISPLKALNNDVQRNLIVPLAELKAYFAESGASFPDISVMTRSGDTPGDERRRMLRKPPQILITTPESLNLLLSSRSGRGLFTGLKVLILDEIHSVLTSKRGVHLIGGVERLAEESGEFQRIGLSATVRPLSTVAAWMGGFRLVSPGVHEAREVSVVQSADRRDIDLELRVVSPWDDSKNPTEPRSAPGPHGPGGEDVDMWWEALSDELIATIRAHRSTLIFCNSRRMAEKLAHFINDRAGLTLAYAHHGSLSKELRLNVEQRMKDGELKAIVATSSLELGIDIGSLDRVVMVQTPFSASSALQRIGRADHRVGGTSRATLIPIHGMDSVEAAVLCTLVRKREIETFKPVENALDVLAQEILSICLHSKRKPDELFDLVRCAWPYRELKRAHFDLVVEMLLGRYADTPIRDLRARLDRDPLSGLVTARDGQDFLLYQSGGTIPDRGYYRLRLSASKALVGELDEEFVWERTLGDQFTLANNAWQIVAINHSDVEVIPADPSRSMIPFWKAENFNRDFFLSEHIAEFLEEADSVLSSGAAAKAGEAGRGGANPRAFDEWISKRLDLEGGAANPAAHSIRDFLNLQREVSGASLPSRHHIVVEELASSGSRGEAAQVIVHTLWGGALNKPFAMAVSAAWEKKYGAEIEYFAGNECVLFEFPEPGSMETGGLDGGAGNGHAGSGPADSRVAGLEILDLVDSATLEGFLRLKLEKTELFGAHFRENSGRALLLPKGDARKRFPFWLNRLRSKKLLDAVFGYPDFPMVLETWRECLEDLFDLESLKRVLDELGTGAIRVSVCRSARPSPFAESVVWFQTNKYMYEDDRPASGGISGLSEELFSDLLRDARLRPALPQVLVDELEEKVQNTWPSYRPRNRGDILEILSERDFMEADLWEKHRIWLREVSESGDSATGRVGEVEEELNSRVVSMKPGKVAWIVARDAEARIRKGLSGDLVPLVVLWLRFRGPVSLDEGAAFFGRDPSEILEIFESMVADESLVSGTLVEGRSETLFCDAENYERLLRMLRRFRKPAFEPLPATLLSPFLAETQGILDPGNDIESFQDRLDPLFGLALPAGLWESAVFPVRLKPYYPAWLDSLFASYGLAWRGEGKGRLSFEFEDVLRGRDEADSSAAGTTDHETDYATHYAAESSGSPGESGQSDIAAVLVERLGSKRNVHDLVTEVSIRPGKAQGEGSPPLDSGRIQDALWAEAWKGRVSVDSFEAVRRWLLAQRSVSAASARSADGSASRNASRGISLSPGGSRRWDRTRVPVGMWYRIEKRPRDAFESFERGRENVRQVVRRYGVVFRELLDRELPELRWSNLFRTMRVMELSGEIVAGRFFDCGAGIQFASQEALQRLSEPDPVFARGQRLWWINAADPASLCGADLGLGLPRRVPSTWMVFKGRELILCALKGGRELDFRLEPGTVELESCLAFFHFLLGLPETSAVHVETINGRKARESPYATLLAAWGFQDDYKTLSLWKRY